MSKPNDGGPAFPGKRFVQMSNGEWKWEPWEGMALRTWLAGMACSSVAVGVLCNANGAELSEQALAMASVKIADAIIVELEKDQP